MSVHQVDNMSDGQGSLPGVPGVIRQLLPGLGETHAFGVPGVIRQLLPGLGETHAFGVPGVIRQLLPGLGEMHAFGVPGVIRQLWGETQHVGLSPLLWAAEAGARGGEHLPCSVSTRFPSVPP